MPPTELAPLELRTRGAVVLGGLIHKSHLIVGDALVRAHELELTQAIHPCSIVDSEIVELLLAGPAPQMALFQNRVAHAIRQDEDGRYFVDYLSSDPISGAFFFYQYLREVWASVVVDYNATSDERIRAKLRWMQRYFEILLEESRQPYPRTAHASERFAMTFPRTADNLKTWVNDFVATRDERGADLRPNEVA